MTFRNQRTDQVNGRQRLCVRKMHVLDPFLISGPVLEYKNLSCFCIKEPHLRHPMPSCPLTSSFIVIRDNDHGLTSRHEIHTVQFDQKPRNVIIERNQVAEMGCVSLRFEPGPGKGLLEDSDMDLRAGIWFRCMTKCQCAGYIPLVGLSATKSMQAEQLCQEKGDTETQKVPD
ncbi:unnamed protein product [Dovyalis caffra]|uniref:Uncharacterized protein n=1 Tax=Dovyalis caffra TaxID=77055 RepID=A0AAV1RBB7_9ROSI|nr:unnamed protein product [Dovyalis caffra]